LLNELCENLDIKNKKIDNQMLFPSVMKFRLSPFSLAFLTPRQMHPANWAKEEERKRKRNKHLKDIPTTDIYECHKCGNRKCTVDQVQIRGADEPMTLIIVCVVCYNTFTK
jgi:transcription elongation factor S-II